MQLPATATLVMTVQGPGPAIGEELQKAVEEIRAEVNREMRQNAREMGRNAREMGQNARAAADADASMQHPPAPPIPPVIISRGGERQVFVGGSEVGFPRRDEIPPQAVEMAMGFFFTMVVIVIGLPIARAFARRMDRKAMPTQIPAEITAQLGQLSQAVDAIAVEVERISEGQRYTTRLLSEQRDSARHVLPAGSDR